MRTLISPLTSGRDCTLFIPCSIIAVIKTSDRLLTMAERYKAMDPSLLNTEFREVSLSESASRCVLSEEKGLLRAAETRSVPTQRDAGLIAQC
jgi:hypothetical protein